MKGIRRKSKAEVWMILMPDFKVVRIWKKKYIELKGNKREYIDK
jgi:hypothetical protein